MLTLSDVDRQAVELFLESYWGDGGDRAPVARLPEIGPRIEAVSKLFEKLGKMTAEDPPTDLASRVMKAVEQMPAKWQRADVLSESTAARQA